MSNSFALANTSIQEVKDAKQLELLTQQVENLSEKLIKAQNSIENLEKENEILLKSMGATQAHFDSSIGSLSLTFTISSIVIGAIALLIGIFAFRSISGYFRFILDKKVSEQLQNQIPIIKGEIGDRVEEQMTSSLKEKLKFWDEEFAKLFKESKGSR